VTRRQASEIHQIGRSVRLDTLVRLRWLAVIGQTLAVLVVYWVLDFELPIWACLAVIALSAWLNIALRVHFPLMQRIEPDRAAWLLAFDTAELAVLLFFTGGLQNPFAFLFLGPVLISATALPPRMTLLLGSFAVACATLLIFVHGPLPWDEDPPLELPAIYVAGVWLSILLAIAFIGLHAWQVTEDSRQLADALAATELALAREQHLSQLDGLAAAAAHELGTPLATITLIAKELSLAIKPGSEHAEDVRLLNEQAKRCRAILGKLTELSSGDPFDRMQLSALIEEVVAPHRNFGVAIAVAVAHGGKGERPLLGERVANKVVARDRFSDKAPAGGESASRPSAEPIAGRNPAILYGLGNFIENAVDFAREKVEVATSWSAEAVEVTISDDGPGFAPEVMDRIGEPYVTTHHRDGKTAQGEAAAGLGLGVFIAKTLLERTGATLAFENRLAPAHGAIVRIRWQRAQFERPMTTA
jgi:two-component system, sensor histidine kinase RegB